MPLTRPLGSDSFIRKRAALVTNPKDNTLYRDWVNAVETTISEAMVQPFSFSEKFNFELVGGREFQQSDMRVWVPTGTDIDGNDRIIYRGNEYEVFGHSVEWVNFNGVIEYVSFMCRRREG